MRTEGPFGKVEVPCWTEEDGSAHGPTVPAHGYTRTSPSADRRHRGGHSLADHLPVKNWLAMRASYSASGPIFLRLHVPVRAIPLQSPPTTPPTSPTPFS